MKRISLRINALDLDKTRFVDVSFTNKEGKEIKKKDILVDVVFTDETKSLASGDTWELLEVGFVTETMTKEEKTAKAPFRPVVGKATTFKDKVAVPNFNRDSKGNEVKGYDKSASLEDDSTSEDFPF